MHLGFRSLLNAPEPTLDKDGPLRDADMGEPLSEL
jgi:hypothetical protein